MNASPAGVSMGFALASGMDHFSRAVQQVAGFFDRVLGRTASVILGVFLMLIGLGMMASVVLLPGGIAVGVLGALVIAMGMRPRGDDEQRA